MSIASELLSRERDRPPRQAAGAAEAQGVGVAGPRLGAPPPLTSIDSVRTGAGMRIRVGVRIGLGRRQYWQTCTGMILVSIAVPLSVVALIK